MYLALQAFVFFVYGVVYAIRNFSAFGGDIASAYDGMMGYILANAVPAAMIAAVLSIFILAIAFRFSNKSFCNEVMLKKPASIRALWPIPVLGVAANLLLEAVFMFLPERTLEEYAESSSVIGQGSGAVYYIGTIILIPFAEEIIFRGLAYTRLRRTMSFLPAAIISSVLFGVCHGQSLWIVYATLMGFMLVFVFDRYRSIWASFLLHLCFNGTSMLLTYFLGEKEISLSTPEVVFVTAACAAATVFGAYAVYRETKKNR